MAPLCNDLPICNQNLSFSKTYKSNQAFLIMLWWPVSILYIRKHQKWKGWSSIVQAMISLYSFACLHVQLKPCAGQTVTAMQFVLVFSTIFRTLAVQSTPYFKYIIKHGDHNKVKRFSLLPNIRNYN